MDTYETLLVTRDGSLATVTLNRPKALHAISTKMLSELEGVFAEVSKDPSLRVVLLTGSEDRAFAAGADVRELQSMDPAAGRAVSEYGQSVFSGIEACPKPVIACLNGVALGGGLELALACTMRLASEHAQLGLPEARLGLTPGFGGVRRLVRQVGRSAALRLLLTANTVTADEALRIGLVDEVLAPASLMPRARQIGVAIAELAPLPIQNLLSLVNQGESVSTAEAFQQEAALFEQLFQSKDKVEGFSAFFEKRQPRWTGE